MTPEELALLEDLVDAEVAKNGIPTDEELMAEIDRLNEMA